MSWRHALALDSAEALLAEEGSPTLFDVPWLDVCFDKQYARLTIGEGGRAQCSVVLNATSASALAAELSRFATRRGS